MFASHSERFDVQNLLDYTTQLFAAAGCDGNKPTLIAKGLVEADLLGHTTHGLQLAVPYLNELESGGMTASGDPEVLADRGACLTWNGRRLPGVWLTTRAIECAIERVKTYGVVTVVIRESHHIGCLAAFLQQATDQGLLIYLCSSDPAFATVAPYGGRQSVYTPDPIAVGIPTDGDPILIDISASITTNGMAARLRNEGRLFPGNWARDAEGRPTNNPESLFTNPPGSLLPVGGVDHGHKGYGLGLFIEALTQGLSGFGRADAPKRWGASVFIQLLDPHAFGGIDAFIRQTGWLARACRDSSPAPGFDRVRLPGQRGLAAKRQALLEGVPLYPGIMAALRKYGEKYGIAAPMPLA